MSISYVSQDCPPVPVVGLLYVALQLPVLLEASLQVHESVLALMVPPFPDQTVTDDPAAQREPEKPFEATVAPLEVPQRDGVVGGGGGVPPVLPPSQFVTADPPRLTRDPVLTGLIAAMKGWILDWLARLVPE